MQMWLHFVTFGLPADTDFNRLCHGYDNETDVCETRDHFERKVSCLGTGGKAARLTCDGHCALTINT